MLTKSFLDLPHRRVLGSLVVCHHILLSLFKKIYITLKPRALVMFGVHPCSAHYSPTNVQVQGLWPDFGAISKIHKKSNCDQNQLKL